MGMSAHPVQEKAQLSSFETKNKHPRPRRRELSGEVVFGVVAGVRMDWRLRQMGKQFAWGLRQKSGEKARASCAITSAGFITRSGAPRRQLSG